MFINQMSNLEPVEEHSLYEYDAFVFADGEDYRLCLIDDEFNGFIIDERGYCLIYNACGDRTVEGFIFNCLPDVQLIKAFKNNEYELKFCPLSSKES